MIHSLTELVRAIHDWERARAHRETIEERIKELQMQQEESKKDIHAKLKAALELAKAAHVRILKVGGNGYSFHESEWGGPSITKIEGIVEAQEA